MLKLYKAPFNKAVKNSYCCFSLKHFVSLFAVCVVVLNGDTDSGPSLFLLHGQHGYSTPVSPFLASRQHSVVSLSRMETSRWSGLETSP